MALPPPVKQCSGFCLFFFFLFPLPPGVKSLFRQHAPLQGPTLLSLATNGNNTSGPKPLLFFFFFFLTGQKQKACFAKGSSPSLSFPRRPHSRPFFDSPPFLLFSSPSPFECALQPQCFFLWDRRPKNKGGEGGPFFFSAPALQAPLQVLFVNFYIFSLSRRKNSFFFFFFFPLLGQVRRPFYRGRGLPYFPPQETGHRPGGPERPSFPFLLSPAWLNNSCS